MAFKRKKPDKAQLIQWITALVLVVLLSIVMAVALKSCPAPEPEPSAVVTTPTVFAPSGDRIPGIDVSYHQGQIDWRAVADSGVEFVFVRLGYRGYKDGALYEDVCARQNLEGARAAGLQVGAYFFSQALNEEEAMEEAAYALEILDGFQLDLPLTYDWEYVAQDVRTGDMEGDTLVSCVHAFCGQVEAAGYEPMVYFNQELSRTLLNLDEISEYPFWFARYSDELELRYPVRFWQYTDQGTVPGIEGNVDLDWYFQ